MAKTPTKTDAQKAADAAERAKTKAANFAKLAPKRMTAALKGIELVGNLASPTTYAFTQAHVDKITAALNAAVSAVTAKYKAALEGKAPANAGGFSLED